MSKCEWWRTYRKCNMCGRITTVYYAPKEDISYTEFTRLMSMNVVNNTLADWHYCKKCKKITWQTIVGYDPNDS